MELPNEEGDEMPIPLNSTYGGAQMIHHHHHHDHPSPPLHCHNSIIPSSPPQIPSPIDDYRKTTRYRECLRNHAASMGGNATDGCGEFMPSGGDPLTCSACSCHRNFHRKETDDHRIIHGRKLFMGHHHYASGAALISSRPPHQMIMSYGEQVRPPHQAAAKKRFRTKFSAEQKEKMLGFAQKVGWKIQKQEEGVVQQFCQEVGVKRRVLKVWMHNNKHTLANKTVQDEPLIQTD